MQRTDEMPLQNETVIGLAVVTIELTGLPGQPRDIPHAPRSRTPCPRAGPEQRGGAARYLVAGLHALWLLPSYLKTSDKP
jgi:hypothetical protein